MKRQLLIVLIMLVPILAICHVEKLTVIHEFKCDTVDIGVSKDTFYLYRECYPALLDTPSDTESSVVVFREREVYLIREGWLHFLRIEYPKLFEVRREMYLTEWRY